MSQYSYPVSEDITEPAEAAQDPGKRTREQALIAEHAAFAWKRALDFGCGRGGNFPVFAGAAQRADAQVLGVDIDPVRVEQARKASGRLSGVAFDTRVASIEDIEGWPQTEQFDLILACQVIGHTPTALTDRIIAALRARLEPGGKLLLLYPFVTAAASETLDAPRDGDYFHLVDFNALPDVAAFRRRLTREAFDETAFSPPEGLLPVRAFFTGDVSWNLGDELPRPAATPPAIAQGLRGLAHQSIVYSIHYSAPGSGRAAIGDMATIVSG